MEIVLTFPLPPPELNPNKRPHWATKRGAVNRYRSDCLAYAVKSGGRETKLQFFPVTVDVEFYMKRVPNMFTKEPLFYYPRDEHNAIAAIKPLLDGIVDAGILPDDSKKYVRSGRVQLYSSAKEHKGRSCVVVTIREGEAGK